MNNTSLIALAQLAGFAARALRETEPVATPSRSERSRGYATLVIGVLLWTALPVALSNQQWRHVYVLVAAAAIASLVYLPLSTMAASEDDDSPVLLNHEQN